MSIFSRKHLMMSTVAVMAIAAMGVTVPTGDAAAKTYKLRFTDHNPGRGSRAEAQKWWASEIEKRTNGQVKVKFYWGQALVKAKEALKGIGSGLVDVGTIVGVYTPADLPFWNLANAPFGVRDAWVGMKTWQELHKTSPELQAETKKKKVRILVNFATGPTNLMSKTPIRSAADLKGLKVRATGGWSKLLVGMGASTVRIGFGELYQALDKGTVDATQNYTYAARAFRHYEVAGHITEVEMGQVLGFGIGINAKKFNSMPKDVQQVILDVSEETVDKFGKLLVDDIQDAKKAMIAGIDGRKVQFHTMDPAERERWKAQSNFFTDDWLAKMKENGIDGQPFIDRFNKTRAKYVKELAEKGYPWDR